MENLSWTKNNALFQFILDVLFPKYCVTCGTEGEYLCQSCLTKAQSPFPVFDKNKNIVAAGSYQNYYLKEIIHHLKYQFIKDLTAPLAKLIIKSLELKFNKDFFNNQNIVLTPVPLHPKKLRQRGFNQAELLANLIGKHFNLNTKLVLKKIRSTKPQMTIEEKNERLENLKNAFICVDENSIVGKTVFLIDDVMTTGATLEECGRVLKQAGAKKIWKVVAAW